ncbi:MAG: alpha/beta fold hydrolase [Chthoniobacterales bacterium]
MAESAPPPPTVNLGSYYSLGRELLGGTAFFLLLALPARAATSAGVSHFANLEGTRVHYTDYGKGDFALVFVHGWNCDETVWKKQAPAVAKKTRVITVDLPGHGQSDKPRIAYTMDLHARALDAVLRDAGAKTAVLVGHSNGTPVVRQFYRLFGGKVRALVIVDGALRPFGDAAMMEKFIAPLRGRDYDVTATRFIDGMIAPIKQPEERAEIKAMMLRSPQSVAVSEMESLMDPALWEETKIDVPVLMILARGHRITSSSCARSSRTWNTKCGRTFRISSCAINRRSLTRRSCVS